MSAFVSEGDPFKMVAAPQLATQRDEHILYISYFF